MIARWHRVDLTARISFAKTDRKQTGAVCTRSTSFFSRRTRDPWKRLEWQTRNTGTILTSGASEEPLRRARFVTGELHTAKLRAAKLFPTPALVRKSCDRDRRSKPCRDPASRKKNPYRYQNPVIRMACDERTRAVARDVRANRRRPCVAWHPARPIAVLCSCVLFVLFLIISCEDLYQYHARSVHAFEMKFVNVLFVFLQRGKFREPGQRQWMK